MDSSNNDFELKPLTEGLGFHRKASDIRRSVDESQLAMEQMEKPLPSRPDPLFSQETLEIEDRAERSLSDMMASLPPSLDFIEEQKQEELPEAVREPLPRQTISKAVHSYQLTSDGSSQMEPSLGLLREKAPFTSPAVSLPNEVPQKTAYRQIVDESYAKAFPSRQGQKQRAHLLGGSMEKSGQLCAISHHWLAGVLDATLVFGLGLLFLVTLVFITQVDFLALLWSGGSTGVVAISQLVILLMGVSQVYFLASRGLFGATLGDWAFDTQVGVKEDQSSWFFPFLVLWRSVLITMTGFIFLPLISTLFRRDIASYLTGLQLFERRLG